MTVVQAATTFIKDVLTKGFFFTSHQQEACFHFSSQGFPYVTLPVLKIKGTYIESVVRGGSARAKGCKQTQGRLRLEEHSRGLPREAGGSPGVNPHSTQPCAATDPRPGPSSPQLPLHATFLPPHAAHGFISQSEVTLSCQAVMFMLNPAVHSSPKTQVRLIALVTCSFPQLSYH